MKTLKYLAIAALMVYSSVFAQTTWTFDKAHTNIGFAATHLLITEVDGNFKEFDGKVISNNDDFSGAQIEFTAEVNSIDTDNERRDGHLKSDDFFNAEKYPQMKFVGKSFEKIGDSKYKLVGDFTIRETTKEIELDVKYNGTVTDPWGNTKAGFKLTGELNRFDYGLKWNTLMEAGGAVVGKTIELVINVQLVKQS